MKASSRSSSLSLSSLRSSPSSSPDSVERSLSVLPSAVFSGFSPKASGKNSFFSSFFSCSLTSLAFLFPLPLSTPSPRRSSLKRRFPFPLFLLLLLLLLFLPHQHVSSPVSSSSPPSSSSFSFLSPVSALELNKENGLPLPMFFSLSTHDDVTFLFSAWTTSESKEEGNEDAEHRAKKTLLFLGFSLLSLFAGFVSVLLKVFRKKMEICLGSKEDANQAFLVFRNFPLYHNLLRGCLAFFNFGCDYLLMLMVMSFNLAVFLSVLAGIALGFLFFGHQLLALSPGDRASDCLPFLSSSGFWLRRGRKRSKPAACCKKSADCPRYADHCGSAGGASCSERERGKGSGEREGGRKIFSKKAPGTGGERQKFGQARDSREFFIEASEHHEEEEEEAPQLPPTVRVSLPSYKNKRKVAR